MGYTPYHAEVSSMELPERISTEAELDDILTRPRPVLKDFIRKISSPLIILGAGGKMGPTLAVLARRAADAAGHALEVIAVSRFSNESSRLWLEARGVKTINADLLDPRAVQKLPDAQQLVYLVGLKFGTSQNPELTWAINTLVPAHVMDRYPKANLVALSTGNVYPLVRTAGGGSREDDPLTPSGEYANSAVARERIFQYFSRANGTPLALIRLNYAVELRYGVVVDLALKIYHGQPVDVSNAAFNCIWQGDANEMILRALGLCSWPAQSWNLTGPESHSVRELSNRLAEILGKQPSFIGQENATALLSDPSKIISALGPPSTPHQHVLSWTAHWLRSGGRLLNKPTHFEVRNGQY